MRARVYERFEDLPEPHLRLLRRTGAHAYALGEGWFSNFVDTALDAGDQLRLSAASTNGGRAVALLPMRRRIARRRPGVGTLESLTNFYTCQFDVICDPESEEIEQAAKAIVSAIVRERPIIATIKIECLDPKGPWFKSLLRAFRGAGLLVQPFFYFGNWYESLAGKSFEDYLAARPPRLRNTLKRKWRRSESAGDVRFVYARDAQEVEPLIPDYEAVHARSWKPPEPYPAFMPGLIHRAARDGAMRVGVLYRANRPIAAQVWLLSGGNATIFKLSYDEAFARDSPGSLLTMHMIKAAIDRHDTVELDFGRGDDRYKRDWLGQRRERWSILAFHPRTARGLVGAARHLPPAWIKRFFQRHNNPV